MPVPLADGFLIVAVGAAFFALIEIEKHLRLGVIHRPDMRVAGRDSA
jgi:hypothetical protein